MKILRDCYHTDQRKIYHALTFAEQSISYFTKYTDRKAIEYLKNAKEWLNEIQSGRKFHGRFKRLLKQIEDVLQTV